MSSSWSTSQPISITRSVIDTFLWQIYLCFVATTNSYLKLARLGLYRWGVLTSTSPQQLQQEIDVIATFGSNPYTNLEVDSLGTKWNELLQLIPQRDQLLQVTWEVPEMIFLKLDWLCSCVAEFLFLPMTFKSYIKSYFHLKPFRTRW